MPTPTLDQIQLPSGSIYDIEDSYARQEIESLKGVKINLGITTTELEDGSTTNPILINGELVTAVNGSIATFGSSEFLFNGTIWQEFGNLSGLKALAYKDQASGDITPSGTVSKPTFTGTEGNIQVTGTPTGDVAVTLNTATVNSITNVGTLPECTFPKMTATVQNKTLILNWTDGTFDKGTLPTKGADTTVATGVKTAEFTGDPLSSTGKFTPSGDVSQPTFSGDRATVTVS